MTWEEEFRKLRIVRLLSYKDPIYGVENIESKNELESFIQKTREEAVREALEDIHTLLHNGKMEEAYRLCCDLILKHKNL